MKQNEKVVVTNFHEHVALVLLTARRPAINDVPDPSKPSTSRPFGPKIWEITPVNAPTRALMSEPSAPCQHLDGYVMIGGFHMEYLHR